MWHSLQESKPLVESSPLNNMRILTNILMLKASKKKPSAEDNNMFPLDYGSFYERKTGHLDKFFSASKEKRRGYLFWFVMHPKPFKHTTYEKRSEQIVSQYKTASNANTKKGNRASIFFLLPVQNHSTSHFVQCYFNHQKHVFMM